jgi:hypothetical protein
MITLKRAARRRSRWQIDSSLYKIEYSESGNHKQRIFTAGTDCRPPFLRNSDPMHRSLLTINRGLTANAGRISGLSLTVASAWSLAAPASISLPSEWASPEAYRVDSRSARPKRKIKKMPK